MHRFSCVFALILAVGCMAYPVDAQWASLSGQFVFGDQNTELPKAVLVHAAQAATDCAKHKVVDESLVINPKNRGIANVVIWAYKPKSIHPSYDESAKDPVKVDNIKCRFQPHAISLRTGQPLRVGNLDPFGHNALIRLLKNESVNVVIPAGGFVDFTWPNSEIVPLKIGCTLHPWMQNVFLLQDHPYMAITDTDGRFELKNLPTEKLTLKVWHEKVGFIKMVKIDGEDADWKKGRYLVDLADGEKAVHQYQVAPELLTKKN